MLNNIKLFFSKKLKKWRNKRTPPVNKEKIYVEMSDILKEKYLREFFKAFASKEHSVENILFIEEVTRFRTLKNTNTKLKKAEKLINQFLKKNSICELNLNTKLIQEVHDRLGRSLLQEGEIPNDLFDRIERDLLNGVLCDMFVRFRSSKLYHEMVALMKKKESQPKSPRTFSLKSPRRSNSEQVRLDSPKSPRTEWLAKKLSFIARKNSIIITAKKSTSLPASPVSTKVKTENVVIPTDHKEIKKIEIPKLELNVD